MWASAIQLALKLWGGLVSVVRGTGRLISRSVGRRAFDEQQKNDSKLHEQVQNGDVTGLNARLGFPADEKTHDK